MEFHFCKVPQAILGQEVWAEQGRVIVTSPSLADPINTGVEFEHFKTN